MPHTIGKLLTRATTFLQSLRQSKASQEVMNIQSDESPNFKNCTTLILGVPRKMPFGCSPHCEYYKGEGGGLPQSLGHGESFEFVYACGLSVHQKCSNYALTNLLFGLCRFI
jgi:hypothetical protein